ncbi:unnamed protein product, partial [Anisakis simplex]|uniref:Rx_N domain-containing protein n=1 Tax=Anisakis simplex TaxID=6269 RepID=A0A0M3JLD3_ANISI
MSGLQDTALSAISKQNAQFINVQKLAENIHKSVDRLRKLVGDELMKVDKCERIVIWRRQNILELNDVIHREAESLSGDFVELSWWMQEESERGIGLSEQLIKTAHISILDCDER